MNAVTRRHVSALPAALALGFGFAAPTVQAATQSAACQVTTYYADKNMTVKLATTSTCSGARVHAARQAKFNVEAPASDDQPQDPTEHPGSLPCEYPTECRNERPTPISVETPTTKKLH